MARKNYTARPLVACEIAAGQILAARAGERMTGIETVQTRGLTRAVTPNLMNQNILDSDAVKTVVADVLQSAGARGKEITLVVPDAAARVVLLDFDTLPDRKTEADAVIRFRLKKALPFDVERAAISYDAQPNGTTLKVIVAVMMQSVLNEYESVIKGAGYQPGVVLPSTLASLGNVESDAPAMVVKVAEGTTTMCIVNQGRLLLYRTLDHGSAQVPAAKLAEDIYPSAVFFQDMYGVPIEGIYVSGVVLDATMAERLARETSAPVQELVNPEFAVVDPGSTMPRSGLAGVLGALA